MTIIQTRGLLRMDQMSAGEIGGVFAGFIAGAAAIGKGLAWLLNWNDARTSGLQERLAAWEKSLAERERTYRTEIEERLERAEHDLTAMGKTVEVLRLAATTLTGAVVDLATELELHSPKNIVLGRVKRLLKTMPMPHASPELEALARQLDEGSETP